MKERFYIPYNLSSNGIDLKRLERETYKLLFLGYIVAALFHAGLLILFPAGEIKVADKNSIQVELVKTPARIIMPRSLVIPKNTTHDTYRYKMETADGVLLALKGMKIPFKMKRLDNPFALDNSDIKIKIVVPEISMLKTIGMPPDSILAQEISLRMPKDKIPFSSNIFVDKGDNQSSKSMIIAPPGDKMAIQGYTHIASIHGAEFSPQDTLLHGFEVLANALKNYTNIDAEYDNVWLFKAPRKVLTNNNQDKISSAAGSDESFKASNESLKKYDYSPTQELSKYPVIYLSYDKPFKLTEDERLMLAGYISSGGFIIIDNPLPEADGGDVGNSLKNAITHAFYKVGVVSYSDYVPLKEKQRYKNNFKTVEIIPSRLIKPLPKDHELFHCFFDFNDGPPKGYHEDSGIKNVIEGIYVSERLVGFYLTGYGLLWNDKRNEEQLKMGINMVVYALKRGKGRYNYFSGEQVSVDKKNPVKVW